MKKGKTPEESEQTICLCVSCHGKYIAAIDVDVNENSAIISFERNGFKVVKDISEDSALAAIIDVCKELK